MQDERNLRLIKKLETEFGSEVMTALKEDDTIEIMVNSDKKIWVEKLGGVMECIGEANPQHVRNIIETVSTMLKTTTTADDPILECELPIDGSRFEGLIPPIVENPTYTIRKKAINIFTLDDYVEQKILNIEQKKLIEECIDEKKNILVIGGTGSGKTTFCNAVIQAMSDLVAKDRIVIIEDTAELQCATKNKVILRATEKVSMLRLLKATMRLRPDRIIVGEVRGKEALDLLKAWNTGHSGGIATVHANSALAGLTRIEQLIKEAVSGDMQDLIAEAINVAVFIQKTKKGREIKEIIKVDGFDHLTKKYITKRIG